MKEAASSNFIPYT